MNIDQNKTIFENEVENLAIVDSGCPEAVAGKAWMRTFETSRGITYPIVRKTESFRFGDMVCKATFYKEIPIEMGGLEETIKVAVVETNIPLLISLNNLESWEAVIDFSDKTLKIKKTGGILKLKRTQSNHLALAMSKTTQDNREEFIKSIYAVSKEDKFQFKSLRKIHRIFGHPRPEKLRKIFEGAGEDDKSITKKLERIFESCRVCRKFQKKESKPKVGFPKSEGVNQYVNIDLKPVASITGNSNDNRQIVYCVDEFSRFTKAGISKNKEAEEVASVIMNKWCLDGPGYPSDAFFMDNGNKFIKETRKLLPLVKWNV